MVNKASFVIVGSLAAAAVGAQESELQLDTIVVTASRTPISLNRTGSSITVITREDIERRQASSFADLLRDVPGIAVSRAGNLGSQTQLRLRGSEANHVLVMIDGVEANDPAVGGEFQFENLTASGIERIEIVRGPQSALWGSDAVSGVINVITRRADAVPETSGYLEAGSFGTARLGGRFGAAGDGYQVALGLDYLDSDGSNVSRLGAERDGYRNGTVNLAGQLSSFEKALVTYSLRHTDITQQFDTTDFVQTGLPADADRVYDSAQDYLNLSMAFWPNESLTHSLKLTYLDTSGATLSDGVQSSAVAADKLGLYYQTSVELAGPTAGVWTFALDHEQEDFRQRGAASLFGDPNQDQAVETTGYVLEYRFSPAERLNLAASARYDDSSAFDDVTTYRLTGVYSLPNDSTRLRASYGTGQKSPTFVERFGFFTDSFLGNPDLRPEQSKGWEIGFDQAVLGDRYSFGATYFQEQLTDEINGFFLDPNVFQFTAVNETGASQRRGVELTVAASPTEVLDLTASYTYLDSTQPDAAGTQLDEIRRPKHMAALNINYSISARANVNLNVSYNGSQIDNFFPPYPEPSERLKLSSYTLVNLAASMRLTERLELVGRIENLLDADYEDVIGFSTPGIAGYIGVRTRR